MYNAQLDYLLKASDSLQLVCRSMVRGREEKNHKRVCSRERKKSLGGKMCVEMNLVEHILPRTAKTPTTS